MVTNQNWEGSSARIYHISKKKIHIPLNLVLIPTIVGGEQKDTDVEEIVKSAMYKAQTKGKNKKDDWNTRWGVRQMGECNTPLQSVEFPTTVG
jgi:hypothetical protein